MSAIRAYSTTLINLNDFTDSRTLLDVLSAIEPAVSIVVASSFVLAPLVKKHLHRGSLQDDIGKKEFRRMPDGCPEGLGNLELQGMQTVIQGPDDRDRSPPSLSTNNSGNIIPGVGSIAVQHQFAVQWNGKNI